MPSVLDGSVAKPPPPLTKDGREEDILAQEVTIGDQLQILQARKSPSMVQFLKGILLSTNL
ncbi:MAG: hypothetical protein R3E60_05430 [Alphaproteobacteria bacterium]